MSTALPTDAEVLDAAFDAFAERGFDGTSVREIARDLGVSHNTIPQRFGTKDRLWHAAVDNVIGGLNTELLTALEDAPPGGIDRLRAMMVAFVRISIRRPEALRLITAESATPGPRLDHLFERFVRPAVALAGTLLTDMHRAGRLQTADVAFFYFATVHAVCSPIIHPSLFSQLNPGIDVTDLAAVDAWAEEAIDLLLEGVVTPR